MPYSKEKIIPTLIMFSFGYLPMIMNIKSSADFSARSQISSTLVFSLNSENGRQNVLLCHRVQ